MAASNQTLVQMPKMQIRAGFVPSTFNDEARTVEIVWSTGARVMRYSWEIGRFYEELSLEGKAVRLDRLNNGAPILNAHSSWDLGDVIGVVEKAWIEGGEGRALIRFSDREDVAPIIADVKSGILRNISVGYAVHRFEQVEGGDEEIPVYRAVDWEPHELSFVPIPADPGAQVRSAASVPTSECIFVKRGAAAGKGEAMTPEQMEAQRKADEAKAAQETQAAQEAANQREAQLRDEATKAERQRQADIRLAVRALPEDQRDALADELIDSGATADQARAKVLDKLTDGQKDIRSANRVETVEDQRDKWMRGAGDWLATKAGSNIARAVEKATGRKPEPGEFRGMTLVDLAREALVRHGVSVRGMDKMTLIGQAFTFRSSITQSTSDFGVLLENVMHKILLGSYAMTPDTWTRFCARGSVSDFRDHNRYRLGMFGVLDPVQENGEFKNKPISDAEKETIAAKTYGNIINLSRQTIINDDMGAFTTLAARLGRAARLTVEAAVYARLAENGGMGPTMRDGKSLFHADHKNLATTGGAPGVATFDDVRVTMASQKDPSGNEILDLRPAIWLGPIGIGGDARVVNDAQYDPDTANKLQKPNKVRGLFSDIVDTARLSGKPWFAFADPAIAPALEVVFLEGEESPVLETESGWRVDGVEWKIRHDFGVGAVDFRGAVRNAGE